MSDREKQIAEFLARKGATVCPPAESFEDQARPLKALRRDCERGLMTEVHGDEEVQEMERGAQARYLEFQGGAAVSEPDLPRVTYQKSSPVVHVPVPLGPYTDLWIECERLRYRMSRSSKVEGAALARSEAKS